MGTSSSLRIGVDGGGSKTALVLLNATGDAVARQLAAGCNPSIEGPTAARQTLLDALTRLVAAAPAQAQVSHTLLCMAGSRAFWHETAASLPPEFGRVITTDDSRPVLELATGGRPGLVLHGGTGSFVAALAPRRGEEPADLFHPNMTPHYAGGLGWRFGDPGSGYDLGCRALSRGLLELQGAAPRTRITTLLQDRFPDTPVQAITRHFYATAQPNLEIASFAPAILHLASEGDPTARQMVHASARPLLDIAVQFASRLFPETALDTIPAGVSGPILTNPLMLRWWAHHSPLPVTAVSAPPIDGVQRLLQQLA